MTRSDNLMSAFYTLNDARGAVQRFLVGKKIDRFHDCYCGCQHWPYVCGPCWLCGR